MTTKKKKYDRGKIMDQILAEIAGGRSLTSVCKDTGMPDTSTVFAWLRQNPEMASMYEVACHERATILFDEVIDISDDDSMDRKPVYDKDGNVVSTVLDKENIARSRLRVDSRKWAAAKMDPKKYGDYRRTELSGSDGKPLFAEMDDNQLVKAIAAKCKVLGIDPDELLSTKH